MKPSLSSLLLLPIVVVNLLNLLTTTIRCARDDATLGVYPPLIAFVFFVIGKLTTHDEIDNRT